MAEKTADTGYYPKSGDELRFYLKHLIKKLKLSDPAKNDIQFDGGTKPIDRKKDRHGYMPGEDQKVYENVFYNDPVKKKRQQGKDWHSKPADTSKMSLSGNRLKKAVEAHKKEYRADPDKYARKMNEGDVVSLDKARREKSGHPEYVMHNGAKHKVIKVHPPENYKGTTKYTLAKVHVQRGSSHSWPKKVEASETTPIKEETMKSLADVLGESVSDLINEERKVSSGATKAFLNKEKFKSKNTHVHDDDGVHVMKLHGNLIAKHHPDGKVEVSHAGWGTKTTKERLNSIAGAVGADRFSTRKHELHHGDTPIDSKDWITLRKGS